MTHTNLPQGWRYDQKTCVIINGGLSRLDNIVEGIEYFKEHDVGAQALEFQHCPLDVDLEKVAELIAVSKTIKRLKIHSDRTISQHNPGPLKPNLLPIFTAIETNPILEDLEFFDICSVDDYAELGRVLATNTSLLRLSLFDCWLYDGAFNHIFAGLETNTTLTELDASNNCLEDPGVSTFMPQLLRALSANKSLRKLDINGNEISSGSLISLLDVIDADPHFDSLNIGYNLMDMAGVERLAHTLRTNPNLRNLGLGGLNINADMLRLILDALIANPIIESLDLGRNGFGNPGIELLADAIKFLPELKSLDIFDCGDDVEGVNILLLALTDDCNLEKLQIFEYARPTEQNFDKMLDLLEQNTSSVQISIHMMPGLTSAQNARYYDITTKRNTDIRERLHHNRIQRRVCLFESLLPRLNE